MPYEILQLKADHALIRPHKPSNLPIEGIDRIMKEGTEKNLMSFGLFDSGSPNYYTYYPDVKPEDMNPSDSEFIYPVYRLLSKVIIAPKFRAIDFSYGNVLQDSMGLMTGQTVFIDHETITGSAMGVVFETFWQESYKLGGKTIPAGMNGVLKIDAKANPRLARLITMDPPAVHSASVTINFHWVKSHAELSDDEFYAKLGTLDKRGQLIRKLVDKVNMYAELSLVPHGADPFAKKLKDGKIVMSKHASRVYELSFSQAKLEKTPYLGMGPLGDLIPYNSATLSFSEDEIFNTIESTNNPLNSSEMDLTQLIERLNLSAETITDEEAFVAHIESLISNQASQEELQSQITSLTTERDEALNQVTPLQESISELEGQITSLQENQMSEENIALVEMARQSLEAVRLDAKKFYSLAFGDKADALILDQIEKADFKTAEAFRNQYQAEFEDKVPLKCEACGSEKVSRKTAEGRKFTGKTGVSTTKETLDSLRLREDVKNFLKS